MTDSMIFVFGAFIASVAIAGFDALDERPPGAAGHLMVVTAAYLLIMWGLELLK